MLHIYYGQGKGKTTAALGMGLRMLGHGKKVLFVFFLKNGESGEMAALTHFENAHVLYHALPNMFLYQMNPEQRRNTMEKQRHLYQQAMQHISQYDMVILDEILDVFSSAILDDEECMTDFELYKEKEIVLTGRAPSKGMLQKADYAIEMLAHKHPYEKGIVARQGVEY